MTLADTIDKVITGSGELILDKIQAGSVSAADIRAINEWIKLATEHNKGKDGGDPVLQAIMAARSGAPLEPLDTENDDPATQ